MGTYDVIVIKCRTCGKEINSQTKILGNNTMQIFRVGDKILEYDWRGNPCNSLANRILKLKNKCGCGSDNAIIIKDRKIIGIEDPKYANCVEKYWGMYEIDDKLTEMVREKMRRIRNGNKRKNKRNLQ